MRKIEEQMNQAIQNKQDWKSGNTRVVYSPVRDTCEIFLHNNLIAIVAVTQGVVQLFDGGQQSNTTKSRLNAILDEFGLPNEKVFAKNFDWFVRMRDGSSIPFFSSMRLA